jgi:ATP-dependent DNA ligase
LPDVAAALAPLSAERVVLDGELVVWRSGRFDIAALQDRIRSGPARVRQLAAATPAVYVVFDLLAQASGMLLARLVLREIDDAPDGNELLPHRPRLHIVR